MLTFRTRSPKVGSQQGHSRCRGRSGTNDRWNSFEGFDQITSNYYVPFEKVSWFWPHEWSTPRHTGAGFCLVERLEMRRRSWAALPVHNFVTQSALAIEHCRWKGDLSLAESPFTNIRVYGDTINVCVLLVRSQKAEAERRLVFEVKATRGGLHNRKVGTSVGTGPTGWAAERGGLSLLLLLILSIGANFVRLKKGVDSLGAEQRAVHALAVFSSPAGVPATQLTCWHGSSAEQLFLGTSARASLTALLSLSSEVAMSEISSMASEEEEFVSDPLDKGGAQTGGSVSEQVALLAHGMLSELQRIAVAYSVDPADMGHLARLVTSALEELDVMISENASISEEHEKLKAEMEQLLRKLTSEQEARQANDRVRHHGYWHNRMFVCLFICCVLWYCISAWSTTTSFWRAFTTGLPMTKLKICVSRSFSKALCVQLCVLKFHPSTHIKVWCTPEFHEVTVFFARNYQYFGTRKMFYK